MESTKTYKKEFSFPSNIYFRLLFIFKNTYYSISMYNYKIKMSKKNKSLKLELFVLRTFNYILILLDFFCAFLEMHLIKIVSFSIMALCCSMVNSLHMVIVIVLLFCLIFGFSVVRFSFSVIGPYLGVLFLSKMAYQTKFFPKIETYLNCSDANVTVKSVLLSTALDPVWWGYEILKEPLISYYKGYILVFCVMTLQTVIHTRQKITRLDAREPTEIPHVLFAKTTRKDADSSLKECFKYLINYGFYKFGMEVTLSFCVILIAIRSDVFSVLYVLWLFILFLPRRKTLYVLWPFFFTTVFLSILWQYAAGVSISPRSCYDFPWDQEKGLTIWLFLPSFNYKLDMMKTLADFVLLLFIQRQQAVFELERKFADSYLGGSNKEIYETFDNPNALNPTPDHTLSFKSWMNLAKFIFLTSFYRITLAFLFWNGASNISILSLGYLVAAFVFFWIDYDLCLWPIKKILRWWNTLLGYIVCVILVKTTIECAGCLYEEYFRKNLDWLVKLLCIYCQSSKDQNTQSINTFHWDVVCFICVIFQRRFFKSYYFLHERNDVSGMYMLQEKGAKLIDKLQEHKLRKFQERERKTLLKIKKNMNRIKAWQKRMHGLNYTEPADHTTATYMGDYFMFQDLNDELTGLDDSSSSSDDYSETRGAESSIKPKTSYKDIIKRRLERIKTKGKKKRADEDASQNDANADHSNGGEKERSKKKKCKTLMNFFMLYLTRFFQKQSRDYHYIKLEIKRKRKKQKTKFVSKSSKEIRLSTGLEEDEDESSYYYYDYKEHAIKRSGKNLSTSSQKMAMNLFISICMFIMSKTELLCYLIIFLRTTLSPGLISLPLPLLVFLWGSLTNERPTKTFWTVLIAYIEVSVVIKALFQNSIFPWNRGDKKISASPKNAPLFMGIHQTSEYVIADLFLLLLLFLHRHELKTLGLWNRAHEEETLYPTNLHVYRELHAESDLKQIKGNRSTIYLRKILIKEPMDKKGSVTDFLKVAIWKCTSRATAKFIYRGNKRFTSIRVKEMEGKTLVTHDGRRLEPTFIHVSRLPEDEIEGAVVLRVYIEDIPEAKTLPYKLSWVQHITPLRKFFLQILVRDWRVSADFYTPMFIFEFLAFLLVFFGYSSFSNPVIVAEDYFSLLENQIPFMYLFTVIAHFLTIVIDRVLYLRKCVVGKLILQLILVIMVHLWMFIIIPIATESSFNSLRVPQAYYVIACFYFLMSAYQLRVGYPLRVQGHFLCNKYGYFNYYAYKGLQLIPFFNQLRTVLDYLCIPSSFTITEWIKMESIFEIVFENKCSRRADIYYPSPRGDECPKSSKYCPGLAALCGAIIVIWLPFIIFAFFNSIANPNLPQEACLEIHIQHFGEIYSTKAQYHDIFPFSKSQYEKLLTIFKDNRKVITFLALYDSRDVGVIKFRPEPFVPWIISPTQIGSLNQTLQDNNIPISFFVSYTMKRIPQLQIVATAKGHTEIILEKKHEEREHLKDIFAGKRKSLVLRNVLPKFIHVTNLGKVKAIEGFSSSQYRTDTYRSLNLTLMNDSLYRWWRVEEVYNEKEDENSDRIPHETNKEIVLYTFNQKNVPSILQSIKRKGVIGLYISIVIFVWSVIRRLMRKYPYIIFTDMPNPDPIYKLCLDIYLARESHEFALEEDLYAKLLFLFRSPETLVKVTRLESNMQRP